MTTPPVEPTIRERVSEALKARKLKLSDVHKYVLAGGHKVDWISYPYVCLVARGGDDTGPKADIIRKTIADLVGIPVGVLFAGLKVTKVITLGDEEKSYGSVRDGGSEGGTPSGGVPGAGSGDSGVERKTP